MKKTLISFLLFILSGLAATAQNVIYQDSLGRTTPRDHADFILAINNQPDGTGTYSYRKFTPDSVLIESGRTAKQDRILEIGEITYYHKSGVKSKTLVYQNSRRVGTYLEWYENGKPRLVAQYPKVPSREPQDPDDYTVASYWDPDGTQKVSGGNGTYTETGRTYTASGEVVKGKKEGEWKGVNNKPPYTFVETYENGKCKNGTRTDGDGSTHPYSQVWKQPQPQGGLQAFYKFIAKNFNVPQDDVSGEMVFAFVVDKDGTISGLSPIKVINPLFTQEGIRVLRAYPAWEPGQLRGVPVRVQYLIPIRIQSE